MKAVPNKKQSMPLLYIQQPSLKCKQPVMQTHFKMNEKPMPIQLEAKEKIVKMVTKTPEKISPIEKPAKIKFVVNQDQENDRPKESNQWNNQPFNELPLPGKIMYVLSSALKTENLLFDFKTLEGNYTGTIFTRNNKGIEISLLWGKKTKNIPLHTITDIEMKGVWKSGLPKR